MLGMPKKTILKGLGASKKKKRTQGTPPSKKKLISASHEITPQGTVYLIVPLITISEANTSEHWTKKSARHKKQKQIIKLHYMKVKEHLSLPCHMQIIRLAPRKMDFDNLTISLKWIVDSLCEELTGNYIAGRADADERISISYDQETTKNYGVKIIFDCNHYHLL
jgi:hypothetical protein